MASERTTSNSISPDTSQVGEPGHLERISLFLDQTDWSSKATVLEFEGVLQEWSSLLHHVPLSRSTTSIVVRGQPGLEPALEIYNNHIEHFSPDSDLLRSGQFQEWWLKYLTGVDSYPFVTAVNPTGLIRPNSQTKKFLETLRAQTETFVQTLDGLGSEDLASYIRFSELYPLTHLLENKLREFESSILENLPKSPIQRAVEKRSLKYSTNDLKVTLSLLRDYDSMAWDHLKDGWQWPQIEQVVSMLPELRTPHVIANTVAALETNLISLDTNENSQISPEGVAFLVGFNWQDKLNDYSSILSQTYPTLYSDLDKPTTLKVPVPRKYLPSAALAVLTKTWSQNSEGLLQNVDVLTHQQKLTTPWLLTLVALRETIPGSKESVEELLNNWPEVPQQVRDALLNKRPGTVWLYPDSRLRVRNSPANPGAIPVFVSAFSPPVVEKHEEKVEDIPPPIAEVISIPFLGKISLVEQGEVNSLIASTIKNSALDEEKLIDDWEKLCDKLIGVEGNPPSEGQLVYVSQLNKGINYFREADIFGIEAIFQQGENFVFVAKGSLGFRGKLNEAGQLDIEGMDDSFIGETEHLFLNNLALTLTTAQIKSYEDVERNILNQTMADWNRFARGPLPKIGISKTDNIIPVTVQGQNDPVLVGFLRK